MHILFLTQVLPYPLDAGPKIRAYYTLRYLSRQHEVTLLSFMRPGDPPEAVEHLRVFCQAVYTVPMRRSRARDAWHMLRSLASNTPFLIARDWVPEMADRTSHIADRNSQFDVMHADQLWMAPYALRATGRQGERERGSAGKRPMLVLDQHNAVYLIPQRLALHEPNPLKRALLTLEGRKLARFEARICQQFDHVVWVTQEDQDALYGRMMNDEGPRTDDQRTTSVVGRRSSVIPICVDPDAQPVIPRRPDAHRVTFLGGLHWPPNAEGIIWFVRDAWPRVSQQVPDAVLTVIGKNPPSRIQNPNSEFQNLDVTGYVDDPTPYLTETAVFIVPLHAAGGMRVKILDAWCWGLPVVTTCVGAEGIQVQDGKNALVADTPDGFAQAVVRILREPGLAPRLAAGGRRSVEAHYDWHQVYRAWDQVYDLSVTSQPGSDNA
jgi:glycosyltransferase involved in cell wall biosynthesis